VPFWDAIEPLFIGNSSESLNKMDEIRLRVPSCFHFLIIGHQTTVLSSNVI